jgi:hypothetical protein
MLSDVAGLLQVVKHEIVMKQMLKPFRETSRVYAK